jgi:hypothetical protein
MICILGIFKYFFNFSDKLLLFCNLIFDRLQIILISLYITGVFFKFGVEVGVEESIANAPPDLTSLFALFVFLICNL